MKFVLHFALILCSNAGLVLACPVPADMTKGVQVFTISPSGEGNTFTYRKTGPARVDEIRKSQKMAASNTVQRVLYHGLLPQSQKVLQAPQKSQVLKDEVYTYPGQNIAGLALLPDTVFTVRSEIIAEDGFRKETSTTYKLGAVQFRKLAGCRLKIIQIRATEDWDGIKTDYTYSYFPEYGFGLQTEAKYPGKTFSRKILSIDPAKR